ncbi:hypothetical protein LDENG_00046690 [Lucifuga dentata]|nr:hypothetical protein LDENG_00046690 [Lucifuga dentata]
MVHSIKYLGVHISRDLTWTINTSSIIKKAHQHLYFLRRLRLASLNIPVLAAFYRSRIMGDPKHPAYKLFVPFPSGKRLRSIKARTTRLKHSFYSEAVRLVNSRPH